MLNLKKYFPHNHEELSLNYNQIEYGIFVGNNQCCHIGLDLTLQKENIYADLSLEESDVDRPLGVKAFLWIPVIDHTPPDKEQMFLGVSFIDEMVKSNKKVYVHCKNGHGRAPTLVIAYYILKKGKSFEEAFKLVKEKRDVIHLDDNQIEFLKNL